MKKSRSGFTIVELLIVIVVIGILAAITIVAYNGVQKRATLSRLSSSLVTYEKSLRQYKVLNDLYPAETGCLGEPSNYPARDGFSATSCNFFDIKTDTTLNATLKGLINTLPDATTPLVSSSGTPAYRGAWYEPIPGRTAANITYALTGNVSCGYGTKDMSVPASVGFTICSKPLE